VLQQLHEAGEYRLLIINAVRHHPSVQVRHTNVCLSCIHTYGSRLCLLTGTCTWFPRWYDQSDSGQMCVAAVCRHDVHPASRCPGLLASAVSPE
jgi:hypothetical protein